MNRYKLRENTFKILFLNEFHSDEEMKQQTEMFFEREEFENIEKLLILQMIWMNRLIKLHQAGRQTEWEE